MAWLTYKCNKNILIARVYKSWHELRSSHPVVFLLKLVLKISNKYAGEHPCRRVISIKLLCNFIEVTFRHECSPVNLLHIFRAAFTKNTYGKLLLWIVYDSGMKHYFLFKIYQSLKIKSYFVKYSFDKKSLFLNRVLLLLL